jgi:hypothetical protein
MNAVELEPTAISEVSPEPTVDAVPSEPDDAANLFQESSAISSEAAANAAPLSIDGRADVTTQTSDGPAELETPASSGMPSQPVADTEECADATADIPAASFVTDGHTDVTTQTPAETLDGADSIGVEIASAKTVQSEIEDDVNVLRDLSMDTAALETPSNSEITAEAAPLSIGVRADVTTQTSTDAVELEPTAISEVSPEPTVDAVPSEPDDAAYVFQESPPVSSEAAASVSPLSIDERADVTTQTSADTVELEPATAPEVSASAPGEVIPSNVHGGAQPAESIELTTPISSEITSDLVVDAVQLDVSTEILYGKIEGCCDKCRNPGFDFCF